MGVEIARQHVLGMALRRRFQRRAPVEGRQPGRRPGIVDKPARGGAQIGAGGILRPGRTAGEQDEAGRTQHAAELRQDGHPPCTSSE